MKGKFLIGIFWTPIEFLLFHSLTIFNKFFVNLFQEYAFFDITDNEKVLAKCGEFEELEVQEFPNEADAFSDWLNYEKKQYEKQRRMQILSIQRKIQARILPIYCCVQRNFPFFSSFFRYFQANLSKLLHFHFRKNIFGCFLNNFVRFFSMINNKFFQFEDFQLQIFQAFIFSILFWEKYFSE